MARGLRYSYKKRRASHAGGRGCRPHGTKAGAADYREQIKNIILWCTYGRYLLFIAPKPMRERGRWALVP